MNVDVQSGVLRLADLPGATGRGVRVAVIDSGVNPVHPHVKGVAGGMGYSPDGRMSADFLDFVGHGTAVTAVIREKAPQAQVYAVKVFQRQLETTAEALVGAIHWSVARNMAMINLSLGTSNPAHERTLAEAIEEALASGITVVAAAPEPDVRWLPGAFAGVVKVSLDWSIPREECRLEVGADGVTRAWACGYPRPLPDVSPEDNLKGVSFAVANVTGLLARKASAAAER
jgi:subtilisin family serine protease